jgi:hypothetical protein
VLAVVLGGRGMNRSSERERDDKQARKQQASSNMFESVHLCRLRSQFSFDETQSLVRLDAIILHAHLIRDPIHFPRLAAIVGE